MERLAYEVIVEDGKLVYKQSGKLVHTTEETRNTKWIFVLSTSKTMYVGKKKKGTFQHSSFLAGGATTAAGRLVVDNGVLKVPSLHHEILNCFPPLTSDPIICYLPLKRILRLTIYRSFLTGCLAS